MSFHSLSVIYSAIIKILFSLNELESVLGKNIVRTEAYIRLEEDETIRLTRPRPKAAEVKKRMF